MSAEPADLDIRITALEHALTTGSDAAARRATRTELAACLGGRYVRFGGTDADRARAESLAQEVLADADATPRQRQTMSLLLPTLTMVSATPAAALREHGATLDFGALRLTQQWRADTDPASVTAGLTRLTEQLAAVDPTDLPPEVRWSLDSIRAATDLLADVQRPDWDGHVAPDVSAQLRAQVEQAPVEAPGIELMRGLVTWVDPPADPIGALEAAITGLPDDELLAPLLRADLAKAMVRGRADGPVVLDEVTALLEQAVAGMAPEHPMRDETERMLAGALVAVIAADSDTDRLAAAERLAAQIVARPATADDPGRRGADLFLTALVGLLRGITSGDRDLSAPVGELVAAIDALPTGHPLRSVAVGQLGAVLADRQLVAGMLENAESAVRILDHAVQIVGSGDDPDPDRDTDAAFIGCVAAVARVNQAVGLDRSAEVATAAAYLRAALDLLPAHHLLRPNLVLVLRTAELRTAAHDASAIGDAITALRRAACEAPPIGVPAAVVTTMVDGLDALAALVDPDPEAAAAAVARMEADADPALAPHQRAAQHAVLGKAYLAAVDGGVLLADGLARAVEHLRQASDLLGEQQGDVLQTGVLSDLAVALRASGDRDASRRVASDALESYAAVVLLQTGVGHALVTARGAAAEAVRLMRWALADGDAFGALRAIEMGRGLTLHAAASTAGVPTLLERAGRADLAQAWRRDTLVRRADPTPWATGSDPDFARAADDLRLRVLRVLRAAPDGKGLFRPPSPRKLGKALERTGRDALAYLVPGDATATGQIVLVRPDGRIDAVEAPQLRVEPDGPLATYLATPRDGMRGQATIWRAALGRLCAWAGPAAVEPLLGSLPNGERPPRVVLVPGGALGVVPWQAAQLTADGADPRWACQDAVLSTAASGRQLIEAAERAVRPLADRPVLVGDPTGSLPGAGVELAALASVHYPRARVLVRPSEATPEAVLGVLDPAVAVSLLHLACHIRLSDSPDRGVLRLAAPLEISRLVREAAGWVLPDSGPTVVAAACESDLTRTDFDEALTVATAFLAVGAAAVVGARWEVPDQYTAVAMFALHHFLVSAGQGAADALRSAQLWMLDPYREPLPDMPADLARYARRTHLADLAVWGAFGHHGR